MRDIDWEARKAAIAKETMALAKAADTPWARFQYKLERIGWRTARLAFGIALAVAGWLLIANTPDVSDTPFAALTLGTVFKALAGWGIGLWLIWAAFACAFGAGPTRKEREEALVAKATTNVDTRAHLLGGRYE